MSYKAAPRFESMLALLHAQLASSNLLPPAYQKYRPLLADGICFFLERLPASRLGPIFLEQERMSVSTSLAERLAALLHHLPSLHKLGQVVARDQRLNLEFRNWLQQLESLEPRLPTSLVIRLLEREFPDWNNAGIKPGPRSLAEGSVAVVMPFAWREGQSKDKELRQGVFKLLKPGIEDRLAEDLSIWSGLGDFLDEDCERYNLPPLDYRETFDTVRDLLLHEIRLDEEQAHMAEAANEYRTLESVVIPALLPFGTPRLTVMERLYGTTISEFLRHGDASTDGDKARSKMRTLAPVVAASLLAHPMFSPRPAALFHADPHAGNLFVTQEGRLGILDWSLAGRLGKEQRIKIVQLLLGALTLDASRMERAVQDLSGHSARPAVLRDLLSSSLRELRWGTLPGMEWLTRLLDRVAVQARARLPRDLLLFRKSLLTLEGVLMDMAPVSEGAVPPFVDQAVAERLLNRLVEEWPERLRQPFDSRVFSTHLSTSELLSLFWSSPATWARYWLGAWGDVISSAA